MGADQLRALTVDLSAQLSADECAARIKQIERQIVCTNKSRAVHGFDFTFAPPKSVSVLWALGDAGVREQVEAAHHDAINHVVAMMQKESIRTRQGAGGVIQTETRGVVAAAFDHWDSREEAGADGAGHWDADAKAWVRAATRSTTPWRSSRARGVSAHVRSPATSPCAA